MPSPMERLEARKQAQDCKTCAWLITLDPKDRAGWVQAISNPRFSAPMVAEEIALDGGTDVSSGSVENHRRRLHAVSLK